MAIGGDYNWASCQQTFGNTWVTTAATTYPYPINVGVQLAPQPPAKSDMAWLREQVEEIREAAFA